MPERMTVKEEVKRLVESLPDDATWDDVMYRMYVHQSLEAEAKETQPDKVESAGEARRRSGHAG